MESFDVNYIDDFKNEKHQKVKNRLKHISSFLETIPRGSVLCAEHTGTYGDLLLFLCNQADIPISLVSGYVIKHSLGLTKGKTDPIDARRIREYGERFFDKLTFKSYDTETIIELRSLYVLRTQLVKAKKILKTGEHSRSVKPIQSISANHHTAQALQDLEARIQEVEDEMWSIIQSDKDLRKSYKQTTSVKGIGPVIATDLIIKTGNFRVIDTARKAASYAGVCPFPNQSGQMVRKSKTSPFADKALKTLLYMGALSAVKHNKEYQLYYRKKELEGKPHYLIMNNLSNKLLRTIYSIVKNDTIYNPEHICLDPRERKVLTALN